MFQEKIEESKQTKNKNKKNNSEDQKVIQISHKFTLYIQTEIQILF